MATKSMKMSAPLNVLYNFHWIIEGDAARSAQPYVGLWKTFFVANGIKTVINLRGAHPDLGWWRAETRACRENAIVHFDTPLNSRKLPSRALLTALIDAYEAAPRPFLIKCSGGQDRTSFAAALYLVQRNGWNAMDEACAQFARFPYLHFPRQNQRWLRHFLDYAKRQADGAPMSSWLREGYDRTHLAAWLEANGYAESFKGLL
ncbi:MAG: hypothetical protein WCA78_05695 [Rhizomicrobium sp.]